MGKDLDMGWVYQEAYEARNDRSRYGVLGLWKAFIILGFGLGGFTYIESIEEILTL